MGSADDTRQEALGPYEHCRGLVDTLRDRMDVRLTALREYIDERNKHRADAITMQAEAVAKHEAALLRDVREPGWVKTSIDALDDRVDDVEGALGREGWVKQSFDQQGATLRKLLWLVIAGLVALCGNLTLFGIRGVMD